MIMTSMKGMVTLLLSSMVMMVVMMMIQKTVNYGPGDDVNDDCDCDDDTCV